MQNVHHLECFLFYKSCFSNLKKSPSQPKNLGKKELYINLKEKKNIGKCSQTTAYEDMVFSGMSNFIVNDKQHYVFTLYGQNIFPANPVPRQTQFSGQPSFPAKSVSRPTQFPGQRSFPAKPVIRPNQFPDQTSYPAKPVSLPNQYWMQELFKFLMQMSFVSYWHILKISYTHIFATILFCSKRKKKKSKCG